MEGTVLRRIVTIAITSAVVHVSGGAQVVAPDTPGIARMNGGIPTIVSSRAAFRSEGMSPLLVPQQGQAEKDPVVAGVLSWLLPGAGSFYAGHRRHGWTHAGIALGTAMLILSGMGECEESLDAECVGGAGLVVTGLAVFAVNNVWAIISGVNDAHAFNKGGT